MRSETSDAAITTFMPQGHSWTSLSKDVSPDGRFVAFWAPVSKGGVLHVRNVATGTDRTVFTTEPDMSGNTFAWSSDGAGLAVAIDNDCQEFCGFQGITPKEELWTVDVASGAIEKVATGHYFLPVAWDRAAKRIAAGVTGPGGYLVGYDVIDLSQKPAVVSSTAFPFGTIGRLKASSDARFVLLNGAGAASSLGWWPTDAPQQRVDVRTSAGALAEWRPGTSEIWWAGPGGLTVVDVVTGTQTQMRGSFGNVVGFRVDGSAVMTFQPSLNALFAIDVKTGRSATLPIGGPFVRVR